MSDKHRSLGSKNKLEDYIKTKITYIQRCPFHQHTFLKTGKVIKKTTASLFYLVIFFLALGHEKLIICFWFPSWSFFAD